MKLLYVLFKNLLTFYLIGLTACSTIPTTHELAKPKAFIAEKDGDSLIDRLSPLFVIESPDKKYNLIGTAKARLDKDGKELIFVDPDEPAIYSEIRTFRTDKGTYTNLIYRVHFREVPALYLGKGKNTGLFVIVTLDDNNRPLLYTTVHTCGCYLAFIPTNLLSAEAYPGKWNRETQSVFGEKLPGQLDYKEENIEEVRVLVEIGKGSHRVKGMSLERRKRIDGRYDLISASLEPMDSLEKLPAGDNKWTSFFETSGRREGYVKGSGKLWERLLMSWWALDWRIGEDKKLGKDRDDGPLFYTSLKPWDRQKSDMRDFSSFLNYWGWGL